MINPAGVVNAHTQFHGNQSNNCWDISLDNFIWKMWPVGGTRWGVSGSLGLVIWTNGYQDISVWTPVVDRLSTTCFMYTSKQPVLLLVPWEKNGKRRIKRMKWRKKMNRRWRRRDRHRGGRTEQKEVKLYNYVLLCWNIETSVLVKI